MNNFKDFNIKTESSPFVGESIQIAKIFNVEITVLHFKITPSIKKENTNCLTIQIEHKNINRIIFTGATGLMDQIKQVPEDKFPFITAIVLGENDRYEFT